jgi:hypothetical protein
MAECGRNGGTHSTQATAVGDRGATVVLLVGPASALRAASQAAPAGHPRGARTGTVTLGPVLPAVNRIIPLSWPEDVLA